MKNQKLAFSRQFALTEKQRRESGAWIFIGNWVPACNMANKGSHRVLCVPLGSDPLTFDYSLLRGLCATVWLYLSIDIVALAARLRAFGVLDILFINRITGEWETANTHETDASIIDSLRERA